MSRSVSQALNNTCWLTGYSLAEGSFWAVFPNISLLLEWELLPGVAGCLEKLELLMC